MRLVPGNVAGKVGAGALAEEAEGRGDDGKCSAEKGESVAGDCGEVGDAGVEPTLRKSLLFRVLSEKLCVGQSITNSELYCAYKIRILNSPLKRYYIYKVEVVTIIFIRCTNHFTM